MNSRRGSAALLVGGLLLGAIGLVGCGDDGNDSVRSEGRPRDSSTTTGRSDAMASDYVGLSKRAAIAKADAADVTWRITREDDERFRVTLDFNPERLNFEIDDAKITAATYG